MLQKQLETTNQVLQILQNVTQVPTNPIQLQASRNSQGTAIAYKGDKKCWFHGSDTHVIGDCSSFKNADNSEKLMAVKKNATFFCCLSVGHVWRNCSLKKQCGIVDNDQTCS